MANLRELLKAAGAFEIHRMIPIIRYTLYRDRLDRSMIKKSKKLEPSTALQPGKLIEVQKSVTGAYFRFENFKLQIVFLMPELVQITWEPGELPVPYAISRTDWPAVEFSLKQTDEGWELASSELVVQLDSTGGLIFFSKEGKILRQELPPTLIETSQTPSWSSQAFLFPEECI